MSERLKDHGKRPLTTAMVVGAAGLAAFAGFGSKPGRADAVGISKTPTEMLTNQEVAVDPLKVAGEVVADMNNISPSTLPNVAYGGVALLGPGTFINKGPVASLEKSKKPYPGTYRLRKNQYMAVQVGREVHYGERDWMIGYMDDGRVGGNGSNTERMVWVDLETAHYTTYAYTNQSTGKAIIPRALKVDLNYDGELYLKDPLPTMKICMPTVLTAVMTFNSKADALQRMNSMVLKPLGDKYKPHPPRS